MARQKIKPNIEPVTIQSPKNKQSSPRTEEQPTKKIKLSQSQKQKREQSQNDEAESEEINKPQDKIKRSVKLSELGNFERGDRVAKIEPYQFDEGERVYKIFWKERRDGVQPRPSFADYEELKHRTPYKIIDWWEGMWLEAKKALILQTTRDQILYEQRPDQENFIIQIQGLESEPIQPSNHELNASITQDKIDVSNMEIEIQLPVTIQKNDQNQTTSEHTINKQLQVADSLPRQKDSEKTTTESATVVENINQKNQVNPKTSKTMSEDLKQPIEQSSTLPHAEKTKNLQISDEQKSMPERNKSDQKATRTMSEQISDTIPIDQDSIKVTANTPAHVEKLKTHLSVDQQRSIPDKIQSQKATRTAQEYNIETNDKGNIQPQVNVPDTCIEKGKQTQEVSEEKHKPSLKAQDLDFEEVTEQSFHEMFDKGLIAGSKKSSSKLNTKIVSAMKDTEGDKFEKKPLIRITDKENEVGQLQKNASNPQKSLETLPVKKSSIAEELKGLAQRIMGQTKQKSDQMGTPRDEDTNIVMPTEPFQSAQPELTSQELIPINEDREKSQEDFQIEA